MNLLPEHELGYISLRLAILGLPNLQAYYVTQLWKNRKDAYYRKHSYECPCGARRNLQLHHRTYVRLGAELDSDLEYKCEPCHRRTHRRWTKKVRKEKRKLSKILTLPKWKRVFSPWHKGKKYAYR
jgi:hypothetical protein